MAVDPPPNADHQAQLSHAQQRHQHHQQHQQQHHHQQQQQNQLAMWASVPATSPVSAMPTVATPQTPDRNSQKSHVLQPQHHHHQQQQQLLHHQNNNNTFLQQQQQHDHFFRANNTQQQQHQRHDQQPLFYPPAARQLQHQQMTPSQPQQQHRNTFHNAIDTLDPIAHLGAAAPPQQLTNQLDRFQTPLITAASNPHTQQHSSISLSAAINNHLPDPNAADLPQPHVHNIQQLQDQPHHPALVQKHPHMSAVLGSHHQQQQQQEHQQLLQQLNPLLASDFSHHQLQNIPQLQGSSSSNTQHPRQAQQQQQLHIHTNRAISQPHLQQLSALPQAQNPLITQQVSNPSQILMQSPAEQLLAQPVPQAPPTSDSSSSNGDLTFGVLQDTIVHHVFFPLVLRKVFEAFTGKPIDGPAAAPQFSDLENRALGLKSYAEIYGLEGACERWASTDVFMAAMVSALAGLRETVSTRPVDPVLVETLSSAGAAMHGADPVQLRPHALASAALALEPGSGMASSAADTNGAHLSSGSASRARFLGPAQSVPRRKLKPLARRCLEDWFQSHIDSPYPSEAEKLQLAESCQLDIQQVNNFFGNKRMRMKRKMMALTTNRNGRKESHGSRPEAGSDSILAPKSKWKAVVLSQLASPNAREVAGISPGAVPGEEIQGALVDPAEFMRPMGSASGDGNMRRDGPSSVPFLGQRRLSGGDNMLL